MLDSSRENENLGSSSHRDDPLLERVEVSSTTSFVIRCFFCNESCATHSCISRHARCLCCAFGLMRRSPPLLSLSLSSRLVFSFFMQTSPHTLSLLLSLQCSSINQRKAVKKQSKRVRFTLDCSVPVGDNVINIDTFAVSYGSHQGQRKSRVLVMLSKSKLRIRRLMLMPSFRSPRDT